MKHFLSRYHDRVSAVLLSLIVVGLIGLAVYHLSHLDNETEPTTPNEEIVRWPDGTVRFRWTYKPNSDTPSKLYEKTTWSEGTVGSGGAIKSIRPRNDGSGKIDVFIFPGNRGRPDFTYVTETAQILREIQTEYDRRQALLDQR